MLFLVYLLLGAAAGVLAGLFGVGGGLIIVPALIFNFKFQGLPPDVLTHMAVGTSLATMVVTSLSSVKAHNDKEAVNWPVFAMLSVGLLSGALLGVFTAVNLSGHLLQKLLGVFALLVSVKMWFGFKVAEGAKVPAKPVLVFAGTMIGWISGMFGIGGGILTVQFLRHISLTMRQAVGTSAACSLPIAFMGAVSNMFLGENNPALPALTTGYVYWPAFTGIVLTSVISARLGAGLAHGLPAEKLQKMFAVFLVCIGIQFLL